MSGPTEADYSGLKAIQQYCRDQSVERGFGTEGDELRHPFENTGAQVQMIGWDEADLRNLRNYYANRLMLIVGEVTEAHEELRKGRAMNEVYYTPTDHGSKPEGIPSELADIVIRVFDLSAEVEIDIAAVIKEKLAFNAGRPFMHGKQF